MPLHVVICGSMSALRTMQVLATELREDGFQVTTPVEEESKLDWSALPLDEAVAAKKIYLDDYFEVIRSADIVLIANVVKHGIEGYVGANTLMEAACGHALRKPVVFLHPIGAQSCQLEAYSISSGVLNGEVKRLKDLLSEAAS